MTNATAVQSESCQWCGMIHGTKCPLVKAIEYEHGMVKRVEFFAPNDYGPKLSPGWPTLMPPGIYGPGLAYTTGVGGTQQ